MTDQKHPKELEEYIKNKDFEKHLEKQRCKSCDGFGWNADCDDELRRVECPNCGGSGKASSCIDINSLYDIIKKLTKQRDELRDLVICFLNSSDNDGYWAADFESLRNKCFAALTKTKDGL